jgi:hypothetical protein
MLWPTILLLLALAADDPIDFGPIRYQSTPANDPVARLIAAQTALERDEHYGYLPAMLDALDIAASSQVLVFSRTSLQMKHITPQTPRAIYFNDNVYVAWIPGAKLLEVASIDPIKGAMFYELEQRSVAVPPPLARHDKTCLACHSGVMTQGGPGLMVRSVFADEEGFVLTDADQDTTAHRTPIARRWGGWYVTAKRDRQGHLGNLTVPEDTNTAALDAGMSKSLPSLEGMFDTSAYLTGHSDIVALLVLEHQVHVHNLITRAQYRTQLAMQRQAAFGEQLEDQPDALARRTQREIARAGDALIESLLLVDEAQLDGPIEGTNPRFVEDFQSRARRDPQGRSLRDFDLRTRLFKHPCSYLVHSDAFAALPRPMLDYLAARLRAILTGEDNDPAYAHLSTTDRAAIIDILDATAGDWWRAKLTD